MKRSVNIQRERGNRESAIGNRNDADADAPNADCRMPNAESRGSCLTAGATSRTAAVLEAQLRAAGMLLVSVSETGDLLRCTKRGEDWLSDLICHSQMGRSLLARAVRSWAGEHTPQAVELVEGVVMVPVVMQSRRRRTGYLVTIILTERLLEGIGHQASGTSASCPVPGASSRAEHLSALCQSAGMDYELTVRLVAQLPPCAVGEVSRLVLLVHQLHAAHRQSAELEQACEQTSRQLAESYEEISLLYTITQAMRVVQRPERFIRTVCEELLGTLPYAWVGMLMRRDFGGTGSGALRSSLAGAFMVFGEAPGRAGVRCQVSGAGSPDTYHPTPDTGSLRSLAEELLARVQPNVPLVLEPGVGGVGGDYERYRQLGRGALVHPVSTEGSEASAVRHQASDDSASCADSRVLGIIIVGEKLGDDASASSVDMKLLGATCNHMAIFLENAALYDDLNTMFLGSLEALTASIDAKDRYTCGHSRRVAHLTRLLARAIGLGAAEVERMHIAGLVHDVGKIGVPERVLLKPGKLTAEEFGWIRRHPEMGYRILKDIPQLADVLPGVLHHHERWDGKGYPKGLKGEEIPLVARLIGLADAFDAMSSNRTYRSAMERGAVLEEIVKCAGTQFDPDLVPHFVELDFSEFDRLVDEHKATDYVLLGER